MEKWKVKHQQRLLNEYEPTILGHHLTRKEVASEFNMVIVEAAHQQSTARPFLLKMEATREEVVKLMWEMKSTFPKEPDHREYEDYKN
jgi:hypothetical protein